MVDKIKEGVIIILRLLSDGSIASSEKLDIEVTQVIRRALWSGCSKDIVAFRGPYTNNT
jgi:hypothetical protein